MTTYVKIRVKSIYRNVEKSKTHANASITERREVTNHKFNAWKQKTTEKYLNMTPENITVLCNRCHYAAHKGLVLCEFCGENYHKPEYDRCYECNQGGI